MVSGTATMLIGEEKNDVMSIFEFCLFRLVNLHNFWFHPVFDSKICQISDKLARGSEMSSKVADNLTCKKTKMKTMVGSKQNLINST